MNITPQTLGIGALAGIAFALLSVGSSGATLLSLLLFFLSPLPILLSILGWGIVAGAIAALVGVIAVGIFAMPLSALVVGLSSAMPALIAGHLVGLARPAEEVGGDAGLMVWYPLSNIMGRVAFAIGVAFIAIGIAIGYNEAFSAEIAKMLTQQFQSAEQDMPQEAIDGIAQTLFQLIPMIQPATWFFAFIGNLYLAMRIAQKSEHLSRPRDDWRMALRMPPVALPIFSGAILAMFLGGSIGAAAAAITGALGAGYVVAGLCATHLRLESNPAKGLILFVTYLALVVFLPLVLIFLIIGLFEKSASAPLSKMPPN